MVSGSLRVLEDPGSVVLGVASWRGDHDPARLGHRPSAEMTPQAVTGTPGCDTTNGRDLGPCATDMDAAHPVRHEERNTYVVDRRDTLWSIAARALGSPLRWRELAVANYGRPQADGGSLSQDHRLTPGWRLVVPGVVVGGTTPSSVLPLHLLPVETAEWTSGVSTSIVRADHRRHTQLPAGLGLLGAGIIEVVDRRRRVQQRHRRAGETIPIPDGPAREIERRLRSSTDRSFAIDVDHALQLLHAAVGGAVLAPVVERIEVDRELVTVTLRDDPGLGDLALPTKGSLTRMDRLIWSFTRARGRNNGDSGDEAARRRPTRRVGSPALVTTGVRGESVILADLERFGTLAIEGPSDDCDTMARVIALELVVSPWSDDLDLMLVGIGKELSHFAPVEVVADPTMALGQILKRNVDVQEQLVRSGVRSFADARWKGDPREWRPLVVVCGSGVHPDDIDCLMKVARDPTTGLIVVAPGAGSGAAATLDARTGRINLSSVADDGDVAGPSEYAEPVKRPDGTSRPDVGERLATSDRVIPRSDVDAIEVLVDHSSMAASRPDSGAGAGVPGRAQIDSHPDLIGCEVEVRVLGPVEVRGAAREFTRAWAKELVVYLALHPDGASNEVWATALWPDRRMAASSLHSTASVARRALGRSGDGCDHLPRSHGRLRLTATVRSDWDSFVALASDGLEESDKRALSLVRGRPFDGLRANDWPIVEGHAASIESAVVDVAIRVAEVERSAGNHVAAEHAARTGLIVSPFDERLYRVLLRCADAAGNPAGVEAVMSELVRVVADGIEPLESVHPETLELYRSLSRRRSPVGNDR